MGACALRPPGSEGPRSSGPGSLRFTRLDPPASIHPSPIHVTQPQADGRVGDKRSSGLERNRRISSLVGRGCPGRADPTIRATPPCDYNQTMANRVKQNRKQSSQAKPTSAALHPSKPQLISLRPSTTAQAHCSTKRTKRFQSHPHRV